MGEIKIDYIETGDISIPPKNVTKIQIQQFGISKVIVVRTKKNGGIDG